MWYALSLVGPGASCLGHCAVHAGGHHARRDREDEGTRPHPVILAGSIIALLLAVEVAALCAIVHVKYCCGHTRREPTSLSSWLQSWVSDTQASSGHWVIFMCVCVCPHGVRSVCSV